MCEEPIKEVTDDAQSDSLGSDCGNQFKHIKKTCISQFGRGAASADSSSDEN